MKINPINGCYYNNSNAIVKSDFSKRGNVSFGNNRRYELAYDIYQKREEIKNLNEKIANLRTELNNYTKQKNMAEEEFRQLEKKYDAFGPSRYDFMSDVEKGRKIRENSSDYTDNDGWSPSENRAVDFTSSDGWPLYTP